jgi:flavin reductase (DIM6/NTAB) family NADH-FMN oxidoreductase RutF
MSAVMSILAKPESGGDLALSFRQAMRNLAGGVSVITVGQGNERTGLTVTSFSALSTEPPRVLVCVNRQSSSYPVLVKDRQFGANVLAAHQDEIASRFAGRGGIKGSDRYTGSAWQRLDDGVSILADALTAFDCEVEELIERHSHAIVIGKVRAVYAPGGSGALVYWRGGFDQLGRIPEQENQVIGLGK